MRVVIQRVTSASVDVDGSTVGSIGQGLMVLVGIEGRDTLDDIKWLAAKVWNARLWPNAKNKPWSESASQRKMELLVVSQFTLHARFKGNKPDFHMALRPDQAEVLYNQFLEELNRLVPEGGKKVQAGKFGAKMEVKLVNDGPVTISIDSQDVGFPRSKKNAKKASPKATSPPAADEAAAAAAAAAGADPNAAADSKEVDVPWLTITGREPTEEVVPLEVNSEGVYAAEMPENTDMTSIKHALHPDVGPGDITDVPLPSGYSVKIVVPPGKKGNDVVELTIPTALLQHNFKRIQEERRLQSQMLWVPFKVPDGAKPGDQCPLPLPNGNTVGVTIPEGKAPGDVLKVRVPRAALQPPSRVEFTVPEGKQAGDEVELVVAGRQVKVTIPEGKKAGDKLQLTLATPQLRLPANVPRVAHKVTLPEGAEAGKEVKFALPSGYAFPFTVPEGKKAGDEIELQVPLPLLDPQFRQKQLAQAQARAQQAALEQPVPRGASKPVNRKKKNKKKR